MIEKGAEGSPESQQTLIEQARQFSQAEISLPDGHKFNEETQDYTQAMYDTIYTLGWKIKDPLLPYKYQNLENAAHNSRFWSLEDYLAHKEKQGKIEDWEIQLRSVIQEAHQSWCDGHDKDPRNFLASGEEGRTPLFLGSTELLKQLIKIKLK